MAWAVLCASMLGGSTWAWAWTGGPETAEVLGWDPADRKIFVALHEHNDSALPSGLVYFELDGSSDSLATRVPWSRELAWDDSTRARRWRAIVKRLRPLLEDAQAPSLSREDNIVVDTVRFGGDPVPRYRVEVRWIPGYWTGSIIVETYVKPTVTFHRVYGIPGRKERLVILAFVGRPWEGGDETQVPVLLRPDGRQSIQVQWKKWDPGFD
jgi:hypothetical protein